MGAAEGMKEGKASWVSFFQWLRRRGLDGVKLIVGDKCMGMLEAVGEVFPDAKYQRCTVHFYRKKMHLPKQVHKWSYIIGSSSRSSISQPRTRDNL